MFQDQQSEKIPHLAKLIDPEKLTEDFGSVLAVIRPNWKLEDIVFKESPNEISRGMLNKMVQCYIKDNRKDSVMIRVCNPAMTLYIDRTSEVKLIPYYHKKFNCAPKILATFENGFCYQFIEGEILSHPRLKEEKIWRKIAEEFAKIHAGDYEDETFNKEMVNAKKEKFPQFWDVFPTELKDAERNKRYQTEFPRKEELRKEFDEIAEYIEQLGSPIVICHMDPRAENMIWNEETETLHLVDFEAITYGSEAMELAIHFSRFAGLNPGDYSLLPDDEFQLKWLEVYLRKYYELTGKKSEDVTTKAIKRLHVQVKKFMLMSHLISSIIGPMIEVAPIPNTSSMDTMGFSINSLKEYFATKEEILALQLPDAE